MDDMFGDYFRKYVPRRNLPQDFFRFWERLPWWVPVRWFSVKGIRSECRSNRWFDEAAFGCDKVITLQDPNAPGNPSQSLKVHIPAGIDTGKTIRLRGKGMPGTNGGDAGI